MLDLQTGNIDVIPGQGGKNLNPQWAPDGKSLAYISDRTGIAQLFIYDFDSEGALPDHEVHRRRAVGDGEQPGHHVGAAGGQDRLHVHGQRRVHDLVALESAPAEEGPVSRAAEGRRRGEDDGRRFVRAARGARRRRARGDRAGAERAATGARRGRRARPWTPRTAAASRCTAGPAGLRPSGALPAPGQPGSRVRRVGGGAARQHGARAAESRDLHRRAVQADADRAGRAAAADRLRAGQLRTGRLRRDRDHLRRPARQPAADHGGRDQRTAWRRRSSSSTTSACRTGSAGRPASSSSRTSSSPTANQGDLAGQPVSRSRKRSTATSSGRPSSRRSTRATGSNDSRSAPR